MDEFEEAKKCLLVAKRFFSSGSSDKAEKFLTKALRLCGTEQIQSCVFRLREEWRTRNNGTSDQSSSSNSSSDCKKEAPKINISPESADAIRSILSNAKDYYAVLGVNKDAEPSEIKKAFRRRARLVHPDKCHSEKATEAFKVVQKAFETLSDPTRRSTYDVHGVDAEENIRLRHTAYRREFTDEAVFMENLFGNMFNRGFVFRERRGRRHAPQESDSAMSTILQVLPLVVLLILFSLSSLLQESNDTRKSNLPFSLQYSRNYHNRAGQTLGDRLVFYYNPYDISGWPRRSIDERIRRLYRELEDTCEKEKEEMEEMEEEYRLEYEGLVLARKLRELEKRSSGACDLQEKLQEMTQKQQRAY